MVIIFLGFDHLSTIEIQRWERAQVIIFFHSGKSALHVGVAKRSSGLLRPTSPKSPVASASAFESVEGSDDEDNMTDNSKLDTSYIHANGNAVSLFCNYKKKLYFYCLR